MTGQLFGSLGCFAFDGGITCSTECPSLLVVKLDTTYGIALHCIVFFCFLPMILTVIMDTVVP